MTERARHTRRGFTLLNLLVTIAILASIAGIAAVTLAPDDRARVIGGAGVLASDLEHAQALSLVTPEDPVIVRIDEEGDGYWLERRSEPDVPITRSDGSPYVVVFGQGDAATLRGVDITIAGGAANAAIEFDAFGRLVDLNDAVIAFAMGEEQIWLTTSSSTGFVTIQRDAPEIPAAPKGGGGGAMGMGG